MQHKKKNKDLTVEWCPLAWWQLRLNLWVPFVSLFKPAASNIVTGQMTSNHNSHIYHSYHFECFCHFYQNQNIFPFTVVKVVYRYDFHENDNDHQKGLTSADVSARYGQKGISMELLLTKNGRMANISWYHIERMVNPMMPYVIQGVPKNYQQLVNPIMPCVLHSV